MSSLPVLMSLINELGHDDPFFGHDFGLGLHPQHIHHSHRHHQDVNPVATNMLGYSAVPLSRQLSRRDAVEKKAGKIAHIGKDGFQVCMDVAQFKPSELTVKVVDNCVVVEGKHEDREDNHGYISRHFVRRYSLPKEYHPDKVQSTLSSDGVLTVSIPKPAIEDKTGERVVQIQQVGPAHLNIKNNTQEKIGDEAKNGEEAK